MLFRHLTYFGKDAFLKNTSLLFSKKIEGCVFLKPDTISLSKSLRPICVFVYPPSPLSPSSTNGRTDGPPSSSSDLPSVGEEPACLSGVASRLRERQKKNPAHSTELLKAKEEMLRTLSLLTGTC